MKLIFAVETSSVSPVKIAVRSSITGSTYSPCKFGTITTPRSLNNCSEGVYNVSNDCTVLTFRPLLVIVVIWTDNKVNDYPAFGTPAANKEKAIFGDCGGR